MYLKKTERFKSVHYELSGLFFTYEYSAARGGVDVAAPARSPGARLNSRIDLGHEPSLPRLYSSMLLAASSVLLAVVAVTRPARR